jgi:hypothetical protein
MGMRPRNLSLVEGLLEHLFARRFVPAPVMHASSPLLDLSLPLVLRAGSF